MGCRMQDTVSETDQCLSGVVMTYKLEFGLDASQNQSDALRCPQSAPGTSVLGIQELCISLRPQYPGRFGITVVGDVVDMTYAA